MPNRLIWVLEQRETGIKRGKTANPKPLENYFFLPPFSPSPIFLVEKGYHTRNKIEKSELIYDYKSQRVGWLTNF